MDITSWATEFIKENGLVGALAMLFTLDKLGLLDKFKNQFKRNKEGEVQHKRKDDGQSNHYHKRSDEHEKRLNEINVVLAEVKLKLEHFEDKMADVKDTFEKIEQNQRDMFQLIGRLKDRLIDKTKNGDE